MTVSADLGIALGIGVVAGLRSMTSPALVCWAAHLGWFKLPTSRLALLGSTTAVVIFSILAVAELVADKPPSTPNRTDWGPLTGRVLTGGTSGFVLCAAARQSPALGALVGAVGALAGTFVGYGIRHYIVTKVKVPDLIVALVEDAIAIASGLYFVSRI